MGAQSAEPADRPGRDDAEWPRVEFRTPRRRLVVDRAARWAVTGGGEIRESMPRIPASARSFELHVEDTGIGIAAESQEKTFNRFYRAQRERPRDVGHTGLGLAIVKHLMRLPGGSVGVESELGRGSTFRLNFPQRSPGSGNGRS